MTYQDAKDELFGIVRSVLISTAITTLFGYEIDTRYSGVPGEKPDQSRLWARVSAQLVTDGQTALANNNGVKLYEAVGLLYVQLFAPRNIPGGEDKAEQLAEAIRSEFRKASPSGLIWFRNQKIVDLPETLESYPKNVVTTFSYKTSQ